MTTKLATIAIDSTLRPDAQGLLPDFCNIRVVFIVVVSAELLAFILALGVSGGTAERWHALSLLSLFIQWIALSSTALLCVGRRHLNRLGPVGAGLGAWLLILLVTALLSEAVFLAARGSAFASIMPAYQHGEFLLRNLAIAAIVGAVILRFFFVQRRTRQRIEAEARARFDALQARIRPHFMFNSMNTIASLTRSDPALAETIVEDLAELFRGSLSEAARPGTLGEELALIRRYLRIESLRLGDRLRIEEAVADLPSDARLPALLLQPLVENAVYHGIEPLPNGGTIRIAGAVGAGFITVTISNPLPAPGTWSRREGHHMALENSRERLRLQFGPRAGIETRVEDAVFVTCVRFPYRSGVS